MSQLYFVNLAIDQLLDPNRTLSEVFSVRIPRSEALVRANEDYAFLLTGPEDFSLQFSKPPIWLERYWRRFIPDLGKVEVLNSNPFDWQDWILEFREFTQKVSQVSGAFVCGVSELELHLNQKVPIQNLFPVNVDFHRNINSKLYLAEIAQRLQVNFPETEVLTTSQIGSRIKSLEPGSSYFLKTSYGSGGGGNFQVDLRSTGILNHVLYRLKDSSLSQKWLLQKKYDRRLDFSLIGETALSSYEYDVFEVKYDPYFSSNEHQRLEDSDLKNEVLACGERVRMDLLSQGYKGPFGFDGFVTESGQVFPIIDLNVRWTKSHYFSVLLKKLKVSQSWSVVRERFVAEIDYDLESFFQELVLLSDQIKLDLFFPLNLSGMFSGRAGKSEFTYLIQGSEEVRELFKVSVKDLVRRIK